MRTKQQRIVCGYESLSMCLLNSCAEIETVQMCGGLQAPAASASTSVALPAKLERAPHLQDVVPRVEGELRIEQRRPNAKGFEEQPRPHARLRIVYKHQHLWRVCWRVMLRLLHNYILHMEPAPAGWMGLCSHNQPCCIVILSPSPCAAPGSASAAPAGAAASRRFPPQDRRSRSQPACRS